MTLRGSANDVTQGTIWRHSPFLTSLTSYYYREECWSFVLFHSLFFPFLFFYWGKKKFSSSQNNVWLGTFCWIFLKPAAPWNNGVLHRTNLYRKIFIRKLSFFLCVWNNILTRFRISRSKAYFFSFFLRMCVSVSLCTHVYLCVCVYSHGAFEKHIFECVLICMTYLENMFLCVFIVCLWKSSYAHMNVYLHLEFVKYDGGDF